MSTLLEIRRCAPSCARCAFVRSRSYYAPPVREALGFAEVEHKAKNNRMRGRQTP